MDTTLHQLRQRRNPRKKLEASPPYVQSSTTLSPQNQPEVRRARRARRRFWVAAPSTMVAHPRASSPLRLPTPLLLSVVAAVAGAAVAVAAADENICFRKRVALCLSRPSSSASISSSTRCRQASLWPLAFVPVAAAVQPGHPSVYPYFFNSFFFLTNVHTPALDSWGPRPWHTRKVSLWHFRFCRHTD